MTSEPALSVLLPRENDGAFRSENRSGVVAPDPAPVLRRAMLPQLAALKLPERVCGARVFVYVCLCVCVYLRVAWVRVLAYVSRAECAAVLADMSTTTTTTAAAAAQKVVNLRACQPPPLLLLPRPWPGMPLPGPPPVVDDDAVGLRRSRLSLIHI